MDTYMWSQWQWMIVLCLHAWPAFPHSTNDVSASLVGQRFLAHRPSSWIWLSNAFMLWLFIFLLVVRLWQAHISVSQMLHYSAHWFLTWELLVPPLILFHSSCPGHSTRDSLVGDQHKYSNCSAWTQRSLWHASKLFSCHCHKFQTSMAIHYNFTAVHMDSCDFVNKCFADQQHQSHCWI